MSELRFTRNPLLVVGAMLAITPLLAACGSSSNAGRDQAQLAAGAAAGASAASAAPSAGSRQGQLTDDQRQIVKTGEITLEVDNVANGLARVRAMAIELGGFVGGAQAGTLDQSASVTLRIPAPRFDDALSRLHEIASKVLVEATREVDVTSTVVDLQARLKNLQASAGQYRVLVGRATTIGDILAVQTRLDDVQGQIEQLTAQLKQLSNQADLSTLTVTLQPRPQPIKAASATWDPGDTASSAVGALLQVGQAMATVAIWAGIVGLPILVVLLIAAALIVRLGLLRRPTAQPEAGSKV